MTVAVLFFIVTPRFLTRDRMDEMEKMMKARRKKQKSKKKKKTDEGFISGRHVATAVMRGVGKVFCAFGLAFLEYREPQQNRPKGWEGAELKRKMWFI
jgi:4'-phosphopantetheinyl transferase EntD